MRIGSLFSGIGGLELGLERAIPRAEVAWQVEQDPYARAVLAKHWPQATRYEDVRQVGAHNLPPVDLLCGGFPCQDISQAGKQAGIDGERSGLWAEYARIISELRPRYAVMENVSALLARGMGRVLGDLAACGYDAIWDCIPAQAVGAHHRRDRIFIVAYPRSKHPLEQPQPQPRRRCEAEPAWDGSVTDVADPDSRRLEEQRQQEHKEQQSTCGDQLDGCGQGRRGPGETMANPNIPGLEGHGPSRSAGQVCPQEAASMFRRSLGHVAAWEPEPSVGRVASGVPRRVDRLRCLGNAVVPQVAEVVGRVVLQLEGQA